MSEDVVLRAVWFVTETRKKVFHIPFFFSPKTKGAKPTGTVLCPGLVPNIFQSFKYFQTLKLVLLDAIAVLGCVIGTVIRPWNFKHVRHVQRY